MKLRKEEELCYKKISKVLNQFSNQERGNLKVIIEVGTELFGDLLLEQTAQRVFQQGGLMTEYDSDRSKLKVSGPCPCEIVKKYNIDNREVVFKVTRYVTSTMDVKYEDL